MGLGDAVGAAGRILLDSPEILREIKSLSDDQRALNLAYTQAVTELRSDLRHLKETNDELRSLFVKFQAELTEIRASLGAAAQTSDLGAVQQRLGHLEGVIQGATLALSAHSARRPALPLSAHSESPSGE